jgi:hypothetical protein
MISKFPETQKPMKIRRNPGSNLHVPATPNILLLHALELQNLCYVDFEEKVVRKIVFIVGGHCQPTQRFSHEYPLLYSPSRSLTTPGGNGYGLVHNMQSILESILYHWHMRKLSD